MKLSIIQIYNGRSEKTDISFITPLDQINNQPADEGIRDQAGQGGIRKAEIKTQCYDRNHE